VSQTVSPSTGRPYGIRRVATVWHVPRSTVYDHRRRRAADVEPPATRPRPGPQGPCDDATLVGHIRQVLAESPFHGEGYRKVWARLRVKGLRTSKERVRRLMREAGLQAPQRTGHRHGPKAHDRSIIPDGPDLMWGTDLTSTVTVEDGQVGVFVAVDHYTAACVGIHAAVRCTRFEALEPVRQGVRASFGGFREDIARGLTLRHDHGSQYLADDFQNEIRFLGIMSSPAFIREPEGNGCAERFIRTLKENLLWVRTFQTVEDLRQALLDFKRLYNEQWIIQRLGYRTPHQARKHAGLLKEAAA
jgi:transposase InsO family protein